MASFDPFSDLMILFTLLLLMRTVMGGTSQTAKTARTSISLAPEKEMATHSGVLAWRIPGTGKPGGLPSVGSHRVGQD